MYCNYCGGQNPDDAVYCGFCSRPLRAETPLPGQPVPAPPGPPQQPQQPQEGGEAGQPGQPTPAPPGQEPTQAFEAPDADRTQALPEGVPPPPPPPLPGQPQYVPVPPGQAPPPPGAPYTCVVCGYVLGPLEQTCARCNTPRGMSVNPDAPVPGTYMPVPGAAPYDYGYAQAAMGNTSGMKTFVPPEVAGGWNWGGCTLGCIWSFAMGLPWWGVASLVSMFCCNMAYVPLGIVLGVKGNEWAWQNRRFESAEHFRQVQRVWAIWGIIVGSLVLLAYIAYFVWDIGMVLSGGMRGGRTNPFGF